MVSTSDCSVFGRRTRERRLRPLSLSFWAVACAAGALALASPARAQGVNKKEVVVEAITLAPTPVVEAVTAVGDLASDASVVIRPEIAGRVRAIGYVEGAPVKAGQMLIRLDDAVYRAELDQAKARLDLSRRNFERANALNLKGHSSVQVLDTAREEVHVNEASVELAQVLLQKTTLVAPFDGVVGLSSIDLGDYIQVGADIVNLERIATLKVDFRLPERYLRFVAVGRPVELAMDALPGETYRGEVYAIDPRIRASDRSMGVRARLPNNEGRLRPGLFARIRLIVDRRNQAIVIPEEALMPRGDRRFVYRVIEGKAVSAEVKIGLRETGRVEIVEGVKAGDTIITAGHAKVREGGAVRILGAGAPKAPAAPAAPAGAPAAAGSKS